MKKILTILIMGIKIKLIEVKMHKLFFVMFVIIINCTLISGQEFKERNTGILYKAMINDNRVNVRDYPSIDGNIILQLDRNTEVTIVGISKEKQFIDSYNGLWVCIERRYNGARVQS